jgi:hypothetical protein
VVPDDVVQVEALVAVFMVAPLVASDHVRVAVVTDSLIV